MPDYQVKYGLQFDSRLDPLAIELISFEFNGTERYVGCSQADHFRNICEIYWGKDCPFHFQWNPWNNLMLEELCKQKWIALNGCASSGKSLMLAAWGLVNWRCDPVNTLVLVTSTSLGEARMRIWGDIIKLYNAANLTAKKKKIPGMPGKLADSIGVIRTFDGVTKYPEKCGIRLIAGDKAKEQENIGKIIGLKNKRVFFLGDEMPELSPSLVEAAKTNLISNYDPTQDCMTFQFASSGNFKSIYDPFGILCTPKDGWSSITLESERWETKDGVCLRMDGLLSPNIIAGTNKYQGLYSSFHLEEHKKSLGEHSSGFWRMCRAYPCPEGTTDRIFSEADFIKGNAHGLTKWAKAPIPVAALDPAFATGGDDAMVTFGLLGESTEGGVKLQITEQKPIIEDIRIKDQNRSVQVARQFAKMCVDRKVSPENSAFDMSGGGHVFAGLLSEVWSSRPLGVQFGGSPSERRVKDDKSAKDLYSNRVTELWYSTLEFVQSGQFRGMPSDCAAELKERRYTQSKGVIGLKTTVEKKSDMKQRTGKSPDKGDSVCILTDLCRERLGWKTSGMEGKKMDNRNKITLKCQRTNSFYSRPMFAEQA